MNDKTNTIEALLRKPLCMMTGEEFIALHAYACTINKEDGMTKSAPSTRITGVRDLAKYCSCCESTIYTIMHAGALDAAIISQIGKKIVFDGDKARELAAEYQEQQRALRHDKKNK